MNIIEAMTSGKPFKRPHMSVYLTIDLMNKLKDSPDKSAHLYYQDWNHLHPVTVGIKPDDIVATDWELKEPTVTLKQSEFELKCREARVLNMRTTNSFLHTIEDGDLSSYINVLTREIFRDADSNNR